METASTILARKLKGAHIQGDNDDSYFCCERFADASCAERMNLEEQRIRAAELVTNLYEEAYAEYYRAIGLI